MYTDPTSRPRVLSTTSFSGTAQYLLRLPGSPDVQQLTKLIAGNQLAVNRDGTQAAVITADITGADLVMHTGADFPHIPFLRLSGMDGNPINTRILWAGDHSALVWGCPESEQRPGIWLLLPQLATKVINLDEVSSIYDGPHGGVPTGRNYNNPGEIILINRWGYWVVNATASVTTLEDGTLLVLESYGELTYAYQVQTNGIIKDFTVAPLNKGDRPVQLLRWNDRFMLAGRNQDYSWIREFGGRRSSDKSDLGMIQGDLEAAWNAPNGRSIALLTRIRQHSGTVRRLFLGGTKVHEGQFTMERGDLFWSPSGRSIAAVITEGGDGERAGQQFIVTTSTIKRVPPGRRVRELLVNDQGRIVAIIFSDGAYDIPIVGKKVQMSVPHAWNLRLDPEGGVAYNSVHGPYIMRWVDKTDVIRR